MKGTRRQEIQGHRGHGGCSGYRYADSARGAIIKYILMDCLLLCVSDQRGLKMDRYDKVFELAKNRGFIWPSFEIYGGASGFYDYGPLGATLKRKIGKSGGGSIAWARASMK